MMTNEQCDRWADALEPGPERDDDPDGGGVRGLDDYLYGDRDDSGWRQ